MVNLADVMERCGVLRGYVCSPLRDVERKAKALSAKQGIPKQEQRFLILKVAVEVLAEESYGFGPFFFGKGLLCLFKKVN